MNNVSYWSCALLSTRASRFFFSSQNDWFCLLNGALPIRFERCRVVAVISSVMSSLSPHNNRWCGIETRASRHLCKMISWRVIHHQRYSPTPHRDCRIPYWLFYTFNWLFFFSFLVLIIVTTTILCRCIINDDFNVAKYDIQQNIVYSMSYSSRKRLSLLSFQNFAFNCGNIDPIELESGV